ncbi:hypothetical protein E6H35_01445 [Candidatus Bathyarchaeota archaeon]|nr:MAG: hypothetical protein E6H35_01445 [Candidatus Bathyarchaeota archaeon]
MPVSRTRGTKDSVKFMQVLDRTVYLRLKQLALQRGVTVQELIRVLLIPDWLHGAEERRLKAELERRHRRSTQKRFVRTPLQKPLASMRRN